MSCLEPNTVNALRQQHGLPPLPAKGGGGYVIRDTPEARVLFAAIARSRQIANLRRRCPPTLPGLKEALRAGFGVRRPAWQPGCYLTLGPQQRPPQPYETSLDLPAPHRPGEWLQLHSHTGALLYYTPDQADALAEDWEIMTETTF